MPSPPTPTELAAQVRAQLRSKIRALLEEKQPRSFGELKALAGFDLPSWYLQRRAAQDIHSERQHGRLHAYNTLEKQIDHGRDKAMLDAIRVLGCVGGPGKGLKRVWSLPKLKPQQSAHSHWEYWDEGHLVGATTTKQKHLTTIPEYLRNGKVVKSHRAQR